MKESLFKISKALLIAVAAIELAISQIHIEMITKLFVKDVGFALFIFMISGLLVLFNLSSMNVDNSGKLKEFAFSALVAVGSGVWYMVLTYKDYQLQDSVMIEDIRLSILFIAIGVGLYLLGSISVVASYFIVKEEA